MEKEFSSETLSLLSSAQSPRCRTYRLPDGKFGSRRSRSLVAPIVAISDKSPRFSESGAPAPGRICHAQFFVCRSFQEFPKYTHRSCIFTSINVIDHTTVKRMTPLLRLLGPIYERTHWRRGTTHMSPQIKARSAQIQSHTSRRLLVCRQYRFADSRSLSWNRIAPAMVPTVCHWPSFCICRMAPSAFWQ